MSLELLDVLDEYSNRTGQQKTIAEVHQDGDWHAAVHVWLMNTNKELLLQQRSLKRHTWPGKWDISVAGHVSAGTNALETAVCETGEELGLEITSDDLEHLFTVKQIAVRERMDYFNREFNPVYLIQKDIPISSFEFRDGEVAAVRYVTLSELKRLVLEENPELVPHQEEYPRLFFVLQDRFGVV